MSIRKTITYFTTELNLYTDVRVVRSALSANYKLWSPVRCEKHGEFTYHFTKSETYKPEYFFDNTYYKYT